jgi:hypothetical protein
MTKRTHSSWLVVALSTLALGACGSDPYAGGSTITDTTTRQGTSPVTNTNTGTSTKLQTGTKTDTSTGSSTQSSLGTGTGSDTGTSISTNPVTITVTQTLVVGPDAGAPDAPSVDSYPAAPIPGDIYISVAPIRQLDLVVMVDNSPSMAPKQSKFNAQLPKLINALKDPSDGTLPDLRIAIIDSDLGTGGAYSSGSCGPNSSNGNSPFGDLGKFQMRGASACGVTDSSATYLEYKTGQALNYNGDISKVFTCLASNLGTVGCGEEHQLQAFEWALIASGIGNDAQHNMLRAQAYLGLVFLTDEDDCSAATNDGMFGDKAELRGESASLRCATRSHACSGRNLADSPPGYPTTASFSSDFSLCSARVDACPNPTDSGGGSTTDTSAPTSCSPLKDIHKLAQEIKSLKSNPDEQILVAGIFGMPISGQNAPYKIDLVPNPNVADTAHPQVYDLWPVCYDPNHFKQTDGSSYNSDDAGWGATPGLRESAFVDEFGSNGMKFSVCEADYTGAMQGIGNAIAKKLQNLCMDYKLVDTDLTTPGLQPSCQLHLRTPQANPTSPGSIIFVESATSIPQCPAGATSGKVANDCWQITTDTSKCPTTGQLVNLLRTANNIATGPLDPGTQLHMQCQVCTDTSTQGCNY